MMGCNVDKLETHNWLEGVTEDMVVRLLEDSADAEWEALKYILLAVPGNILAMQGAASVGKTRYC